MNLYVFPWENGRPTSGRASQLAAACQEVWAGLGQEHLGTSPINGGFQWENNREKDRKIIGTWRSTLWSSKMAMDNPPFANDVPIKSPFCRGFPIAAVECRRVDLLQTWNTMGIRDITRHISDILIDLLASSSWLIIIWDTVWNTMWYNMI